MRVWREAGSEQPFRARFTAVHADGHTAEVAIAASPEAVLAIVSQWLEEFLSVDLPPEF
jgi:hypothetical protein